MTVDEIEALVEDVKKGLAALAKGPLKELDVLGENSYMTVEQLVEDEEGYLGLLLRRLPPPT